MTSTLYWLQGGGCGGDTMALLSTESPDLIELLLPVLRRCDTMARRNGGRNLRMQQVPSIQAGEDYL